MALGKSATPDRSNSVPFNMDWLPVIRTTPVKPEAPLPASIRAERAPVRSGGAAEAPAAVGLPRGFVAALAADFFALGFPRFPARFLEDAAARFFALAGVRL